MDNNVEQPPKHVRRAETGAKYRSRCLLQRDRGRRRISGSPRDEARGEHCSVEEVRRSLRPRDAPAPRSGVLSWETRRSETRQGMIHTWRSKNIIILIPK